MRSRTLVTLAGTVGITIALSFPVAASAHVELDASTSTPATISVLTFAVGHGCEGSATTALAIDIPREVQSVTPTVKPGWSVAEQETATGRTVTYTASTPLEDGYRDTVEISAMLPVDGQAGDIVVFPVLQTCVEGSTAWDQISEDDTEPNLPAPTLTLTNITATVIETEISEAALVAAVSPVDGTARLLGVGGLLVGVVAVLLLTMGMRRQQQGGKR